MKKSDTCFIFFYDVTSGGKLTGKMTFEPGAGHVTVYSSGTVDFDLRQTKADADPLLNDFSFVTDNNLSFTLTVDGTQADGVYKLAGNAAEFGGRTITVVNASDETLGTLTLGGEGVEIGGKKYTLILDNTTLAVLVGDPDSTPPTVTGVKADITDPTNGNVTVTAVFADETELKSSLYRLDDGDWKAYPDGGVVVSQNATVSFKAVDAAGNESAEVSCIVSNIDKTPPANPTASADVTAPTNGNVTVTAVFSDDSAKKEYSLDGTNWLTYTQPIPFAENGTAFFRGTDAAGNLSGEVSYAVTNIDKTPPANPTASADVTAPTDDKVTVSARFSDDSAKKEYSLDGTTWQAYTGPVSFTSNGTAYFRGTDAAGNVSGITKYEVGNIQKGVDEPLNDWLYDKKTKEVNTNVMSSYGTHLNAAGTEIFLDQIDSIDHDGYHNRVEKAVKGEERDTVDYAKLVLAKGAKLSFHAEATAAATFTVYSLTQNKKGKYTLKQLQTLKLKDKDKDGVFTADSKKPLSLQESGAYYVSMKYADKRKDVSEAYYNVSLNGADKGTEFFLDDDSGWNNWLYDKKKTPDDNSANLNDVTVDSVGDPIRPDNKCYVEGDNFVGFGDDTDFVKIRLDTAAKLSLNLTGVGAADVKNSGALKVVIYSFDAAKKKMKMLQTTAVKAADLIAGTANTKLKLLEAGDYYVSVKSTKAKKGDRVYYNMSVGSDTVFFVDGDTGLNNYDSKAKSVSAKVRANPMDPMMGELVIDGIIPGEADVNVTVGGVEYHNFVGYDDVSDVLKVNAAVGDTLSLKVTSTDAVSLTLYGFKNGKVTSLKSVKTRNGVAQIDNFTFKEKNGTEFFVGVTSTNAKQGGSAFYNVDVASFTPSGSDADALAMTGALSFGQYDADALTDASGWQIAAKLA